MEHLQLPKLTVLTRKQDHRESRNNFYGYKFTSKPETHNPGNNLPAAPPPWHIQRGPRDGQRCPLTNAAYITEPT